MNGRKDVIFSKKARSVESITVQKNPLKIAVAADGSTETYYIFDIAVSLS